MGDVVHIRRVPSIVEKLSHKPERRYHVLEDNGFGGIRPVWEADDLAVAEANRDEFPGSWIVDTWETTDGSET